LDETIAKVMPDISKLEGWSGAQLSEEEWNNKLAEITSWNAEEPWKQYGTL